LGTTNEGTTHGESKVFRKMKELKRRNQGFGKIKKPESGKYRVVSPF